MPAEEHEAPKGLFEGTIFEGGLGGKSSHAAHGGHDHGTWKTMLLDGTWFEHFIFEWLAEWGVSRALSLWIVFVGLLFILGHEVPSLPIFITEWMTGTAPLWLPVTLWIATWSVWVWYIQGLYISGRDPVLLEVKIPREISKSPRAMEIALSSFWFTSSETTFLHRAWRGQVRVWYSLEYASFGGEVHMYVWVPKSHRNIVESALYAQFPEIELHQVEDYASKFKYDRKNHKVFATDWAYPKGMSSDPGGDAYPIKTYIDFELDKDPKEEFKVEPLAQMFEFLSSLRPGEQVWIQIIFRASGKYGSVLSPGKGDKDWLKRVRKAVDEIRNKASINVGKEEAPESDPKKYGSFPRPTWSQTEQIRTMERHMGKVPFDVAMRGAYFADTTKASFSSASYTANRWIWKPLNNPGYLNELKPVRGHNPFDYPWQDFMDMRYMLVSERFFDAYRRRIAFHAPWTTPYQVMTNESLATMWHFPSSGVASPGLERIAATKAEPPHNLPK